MSVVVPLPQYPNRKTAALIPGYRLVPGGEGPVHDVLDNPELVAKVYRRGKRPPDLELDGEFTFRPAPAGDRRLMTAYAAAVVQDRFERPIWDRGAKGALPKARPSQHPSVDSLRCGKPQRCCRLSAGGLLAVFGTAVSALGSHSRRHDGASAAMCPELMIGRSGQTVRWGLTLGADAVGCGVGRDVEFLVFGHVLDESVELTHHLRNDRFGDSAPRRCVGVEEGSSWISSMVVEIDLAKLWAM